MTDAHQGAVGREPGRPSGDTGDQPGEPGGPDRHTARLAVLLRVVGTLRARLTRPGTPRPAMVVGAALALVVSGMFLQHHLERPDQTAVSTTALAAGTSERPSNPATASTGGVVSALPGTDQVVAGTAADGPPLAETDDKAAAATVVHIPKLGINQPLVGLHIQGDQSLSVPNQFGDIGWWDAGPRPGAPGAVVVAAHVTSRAGPAIFARLKELSPGDQVMVDRADKSTAVFQVVDKRSYSRSTFPDEVVYRTTGKSSLHLVTCDGTFNASLGQYPDNLVVFADLVSTGPTR